MAIGLVFMILTALVLWNKAKIERTAKALEEQIHHSSADSALALFKRKTLLDLQDLKRQIHDLKKSGSQNPES